ncbi:PEST proteolytic signal-containing nuclear protein [Mantella aurantiaca]
MADKTGSLGGPEEEAENEVKTKTVSSSNGGESSSRSAEKRSADTSSEESSTQPGPPKVSKVGFALGGQIGKKSSSSSISIKLGASKPKDVTPTSVKKKSSVASVFNEDDSEPEEMPPEAKMRMKNIGRDTPTSAGPNSFNKGKHGFTDTQKLWERNMKSKLDDGEDD